MKTKFMTSMASAVLLTLLTASATVAFPENAFACGCCKGEASAGTEKAEGGGMCGKSGKDKKAGGSCMAGMGDMAMSQTASDNAMMSGMDHSKMDMGAASSGNPDADFAKAMIPHHQGAVEMAKDVLKNGKDPDIKKLAEAMIEAQSKEIEFLNGWLAKNAK
jgi:uncharacterized protein (DUF305 family)